MFDCRKLTLLLRRIYLIGRPPSSGIIGRCLRDSQEGCVAPPQTVSEMRESIAQFSLEFQYGFSEIFSIIAHFLLEGGVNVLLSHCINLIIRKE